MHSKRRTFSKDGTKKASVPLDALPFLLRDMLTDVMIGPPRAFCVCCSLYHRNDTVCDIASLKLRMRLDALTHYYLQLGRVRVCLHAFASERMRASVCDNARHARDYVRSSASGSACVSECVSGAGRKVEGKKELRNFDCIRKRE